MEYVFEGSKDRQHNTSAISLSDGRFAGVGESIDLSPEEYELLSKTLNLSSSDGVCFDSVELEPEVTDLPNSPEQSGTVEEELENNQ